MDFAVICQTPVCREVVTSIKPKFKENSFLWKAFHNKDSTVLMDIARKLYPGIRAVFVDTGLEYPEIRKFVKEHENVDIIRPKMNFRQVIIKYGYPMIGKEVAECVYGARRYLKKLEEWEKGEAIDGIISNHSYMAVLAGIDRREDKGNAAYQSLMRGRYQEGIPKCPSGT